jgi:lactate permease
MDHSGMTLELAHTAVTVTGSMYPMVAAVIGSIGTFITGSATSSCVLFGKLQTGSAQAIGASESVQAWIAASNATGACAGKMISPQSIAIGVAAIGAKGIDGQLLQFAVKVYLPFIIVMGCIVYFGQSLVG